MKIEIEISEDGQEMSLPQSADGVFSIKIINGVVVLVSGNTSGLVDIAKAILTVAYSKNCTVGKPHIHLDPGDMSTSDSQEIVIMLDKDIEDV